MSTPRARRSLPRTRRASRVGPGTTGNLLTPSASPNLVEVAQGQFAKLRVNVRKGAATTGEAQLSLEVQNGAAPCPPGWA
ncbi:hypothetical protein [Deinococcus aestuarii]|uniref:hypothetical protein n=1 Tax=Deinococcus aestuarii TaxID=2774531 RepID=UPI001C0D1BAB|nr:hypothetical protein [Deinococcus aestuarii]